MLEDHKRTGAYYNACIQNMAQFKDKVVLDVGTGSGILAIFAARAGARKVYAVEATDMAKHARRLVAAQGLAGTVEVIQGVIESVELPEQVDIIISEWMVRGVVGFHLLMAGTDLSADDQGTHRARPLWSLCLAGQVSGHHLPRQP